MSQSPDRARAIAFLQSHGSASELARLRILVEGTQPTDEEVSAILAGQRADGGWTSFWAADYSAVDATCFRLAQAEQGGIPPEHEAIQRAIQFLRSRQRADGAWEEDATVADAAPPWAKPGDLAARLYLTANSAYWLARLLPDDAAAGRGATLLHDHLDERGCLPSFLHTHWLAAAVWYRLGDRELAERTLAAISGQLDQTTPASSLSWLITCLRMVAAPANHPAIVQALTLLERGQRADGGWTSEDGPSGDAHTTLEALRALHLCGEDSDGAA